MLSSLKARSIPKKRGGQDGRTVSEESRRKSGAYVDVQAVNHIQERLLRFLKESDDAGVPKGLPKPDLKAIAMESDAGNSIKAGLQGGDTIEITLLTGTVVEIDSCSCDPCAWSIGDRREDVAAERSYTRYLDGANQRGNLNLGS